MWYIFEFIEIIMGQIIAVAKDIYRDILVKWKEINNKNKINQFHT